MRLVDIDNVILKLKTSWKRKVEKGVAESSTPFTLKNTIESLLELFNEEPEIKVENLNRDTGKWVCEHGLITPGGDPYYKCSNCGGGGHLYGVEFPTHWEYCPDCGSHNGME